MGPVLREPTPSAVGVGDEAEAERLHRLVAVGELAGGIVFAPEAGSRGEGVPNRREAKGPLRIGAAEVALGEGYPVFDSGAPVVSSSAGAHAVISDEILFLGMDPAREWGRLGLFWALEAIAAYLLERLDRPLLLPPAVAMLRLDDLPGTAQLQLEGSAKSDRRQQRRLRRHIRGFEEAGAVLNVAVPAQALDGERRVPLDTVWPRSVAEFRAGVEAGAVEAVCHGLLHLDTDRLARGEIEFREFAHLDEEEAGRRIDVARAWQEEAIGPSRTFVAPAWSYSEGALRAAAKRGVPCFRRCRLGSIYESGFVFETLLDGRGIQGLDYRPLAELSRLGLPPLLVMHGALLDVRAESLRLPRDAGSVARLALRRDLARLPHVEGVRWVGGGEYAATLERHDRVLFEERGVQAPPGTELRVRTRTGIESVTS